MWTDLAATALKFNFVLKQGKCKRLSRGRNSSPIRPTKKPRNFRVTFCLNIQKKNFFLVNTCFRAHTSRAHVVFLLTAFRFLCLFIPREEREKKKQKAKENNKSVWRTFLRSFNPSWWMFLLESPTTSAGHFRTVKCPLPLMENEFFLTWRKITRWVKQEVTAENASFLVQEKLKKSCCFCDRFFRLLSRADSRYRKDPKKCPNRIFCMCFAAVWDHQRV